MSSAVCTWDRRIVARLAFPQTPLATGALFATLVLAPEVEQACRPHTQIQYAILSRVNDTDSERKDSKPNPDWKLFSGDGALWHQTTPQNLRGIYETGEISPNRG